MLRQINQDFRVKRILIYASFCHSLSSNRLNGRYLGSQMRLGLTKPDEYEAVTCPACMRLHFVHKITGKLLGETWLLDSVMGVPRSHWPSRGH
jgi:hypothetical protein